MELVVLSGKGGTGKTTISIALSELEHSVMKVDCDVDAPNLYLFYDGEDIKKSKFVGGKIAVKNKDLCIKCGKCEKVCKFDAIHDLEINSLTCEGCGACGIVCPKNAINLEDEKTADTFITQLDKGKISRAEMEIGSDGSGKLISQLRKNAREHSQDEKLTIIDGSPGIGCSVISSVSGSYAALIVTEPTKSGLEDLKRVVSLCEHFGIFTMVCINKYDINEDMSIEIEKYIKDKGLELVGRIPYDDLVVKCLNELKPIIYYENSKAGNAIKEMWLTIKKLIFREEE